jgi:hypothetical protein
VKLTVPLRAPGPGSFETESEYTTPQPAGTGDLVHEESSTSLRLFAEEVMPAIETADIEA